MPVFENPLFRHGGWGDVEPPLGGAFVVNRDSQQYIGLAGWWPMIPSAGLNQVLNLFDRGAVGTFFNSPIWTPEPVHGWSLDFNGTDSYVTVGAVPAFPEGNNPRTFTCWFYVDTFGNGTQRCLWSQGTGGGAGTGFRLHTVSNALGLAFNNHRSTTTTTALTTGTWYHAAVVVPHGATTTDQVKVYINGVEQSLTTSAGSPQTLNTAATNFRFGTGRTGTEYHDGRLTDLRLYDRPLAPEIIYQMQAVETMWELYQPAGRFMIMPAAGGGAVTINMDTLGLTAAAQTLDLVPGAVSPSMDTLGLATSPQALNVQAGATALLLDTLGLTAAARALDLVPGAVSRSMDALGLTAVAQTLDVSPGAASLLMDMLGLTAAAQALDLVAVTNIQVDTLGLTAAAHDTTVVPGATSRDMDTLGLTAAARALDLVPGAVSRSMDTLALTAAPQDLTVSPGTVSLLMDALGLTAVPQDLTVFGAPVVNGGHTTAQTEGTSHVINAPTHSEGDLICIWFTIQAAVTTTAPTDFTNVTGDLQFGALTAVLFTKVATAGEPANYTIGTSGSERASIIAWSVSDHNAISDFETQAGNVSAFGPIVVCPAATAANDNSLVLRLVSTSSELGSPFQDLSGYTQIDDHSWSSASAAGAQAIVQLSSGAVGSAEIQVGTSGSYQYYTATVVVAPVPTGANITVSMDTLGLVVAAQTLAVEAVTNIPLDTLGLTAVSQDLAVTTGAVALLLDVLGLAVAEQDLTVTPGAASLEMDTLNLAAVPQTLDLLSVASIPLDALGLTAVPQTLDVVPGNIAALMDTLGLTAAAQTLAVTTGTIISLGTLGLIAAPQALDVVPGAISALVNTLGLTATAQDLTLLAGTVSMPMDTLDLLASPQTVGVVPGETAVLLDTLSLNATAQDLTVAPGGVSLLVNALGLAATAENTTVESALIIALDTLSLAAATQTLNVQAGDVTVLLDALALGAGAANLVVVILSDGLDVSVTAVTIVSAPNRVAVISLPHAVTAEGLGQPGND